VLGAVGLVLPGIEFKIHKRKTTPKA
jgi:hypothetical protein